MLRRSLRLSSKSSCVQSATELLCELPPSKRLRGRQSLGQLSGGSSSHSTISSISSKHFQSCESVVNEDSDVTVSHVSAVRDSNSECSSLNSYITSINSNYPVRSSHVDNTVGKTLTSSCPSLPPQNQKPKRRLRNILTFPVWCMVRPFVWLSTCLKVTSDIFKSLLNRHPAAGRLLMSVLVVLPWLYTAIEFLYPLVSAQLRPAQIDMDCPTTYFTSYQSTIKQLKEDIKNLKLASEKLQMKFDDLTEPKPAASVEELEQIVQRALSLYRADGIGMADYALESSGALLIKSRCSESYTVKPSQPALFGLPLLFKPEGPRVVLQPELYPGKCWAFHGSKGFIGVSLSHPVRITHVSLDHIPLVLSPTGHINSAPKDFAVYGLDNEEDQNGELLGTFTYDRDGEPTQTFKVLRSPSEVYRQVELRVLSNWGHPEYTCLYRFRVHGQPLSTSTPSAGH